MNAFESLLFGEFVHQDFAVRLTYTFGHFVWQGIVTALFVMLVTRMLCNSSANLRYLISISGLLLMGACIPLTFLLVRVESESALVGPKETSVEMSETTRKELSGAHKSVTEFEPTPISPPATTGVENHGQAVDSDTNHQIVTAPDVEIVPSRAVATPLGEPIVKVSTIGYDAEPAQKKTAIEVIAPIATMIYLLGVLLMLSRLAFAILGGHRLRRLAIPVTDRHLLAQILRQARLVGLRAAPAVAYCQRITVPVVVGVFKPMILLPASLATGLSADQMRAVLAHELAHIRRFDLLVNLLQRVIESLLFFHPAVWIVSRCASHERENCCDDLVLSSGWKRVEYADALVRMAEICAAIRGGSVGEHVSALAATDPGPSQFKSRVLRLLGNEQVPKLRVNRASVLIGLPLVGVLSLAHFVSPIANYQADAVEVATDETEDTPDAAVTNRQLLLSGDAREHMDELFAVLDEEPKKPKTPEQIDKETELAAARARLEIAQAKLNAAEAQLHFQRNNLARLSKLVEERAATQEQVAQARKQVQLVTEDFDEWTKRVFEATDTIKRLTAEAVAPKDDKEEADESRQDDEPFSGEFYKGGVDEAWFEWTTKNLYRQVSNADAIVLGTQAIAGGSEFTEAAYVVHHVLKGSEFLKPHLKRKDFRGNLGEQNYVLVEYLNPGLKRGSFPVTEPSGMTILFLRHPQRSGNNLSILGDRVYQGMAYATKDFVRQTEEMTLRLNRLLGFFKTNGFPLKRGHDDYIIETTPEGPFISTGFLVYPSDRDHASISRELSNTNAATIYNPYCRIAMFQPGFTGTRDMPADFKWPEHFSKMYSDDNGRFQTMFRDYRPQGTDDSPSRSEVAWFTETHADAIMSHFADQGLKLKRFDGKSEQKLLRYELAEPPVDGVQILFGVHVYPPRISKKAIATHLRQYQFGVLDGSLPGTVNGNCVLVGPLSSQTATDAVKQAEKKVTEAFLKLDLEDSKPMAAIKTADEARRAFLSRSTALFGAKWRESHKRILTNDNRNMFIRRRTFVQAHERVTDTLQEQEKRRCIVYGDIDSLDRRGECWSIEASEYPYTIGGFLDATTGKLIFVWNIPEG